MNDHCLPLINLAKFPASNRRTSEPIAIARLASQVNMDIRTICTEADYKATLKEISALMELDPDLRSPEGELLDALVTSVVAYEAEHFPFARKIDR